MRLRGTVTLSDLYEIQEVIDAAENLLKTTARDYWTPDRGRLRKALESLSRRVDHGETIEEEKEGVAEQASEDPSSRSKR